MHSQCKQYLRSRSIVCRSNCSTATASDSTLAQVYNCTADRYADGDCSWYGFLQEDRVKQVILVNRSSINTLQSIQTQIIVKPHHVLQSIVSRQYLDCVDMIN